MQQTQPDTSPGAALNQMATITTAHLILIVVLAVLVIAGLIYGTRLARKRKAAERTEIRDYRQAQEEGRLEQDEAAADTTAVDARPPSPAPAPAVPSPAGSADMAPPASVVPPVAPPPPPLAGDDEPVPATPAYGAVPASPAGEMQSAREGAASPTPTATPDDADAPVTILKGLGPKVAARLEELGITRVGQIAALSPAEADRLDAELGNFRGRMGRDRWIEQAKLLAAGDRAGYEATFGKL